MKINELIDERATGYVVGNSCFAAEVTPKGRMFRNIRYNPCSFEAGKNGIMNAGTCGFTFETDGIAVCDNELTWDFIDRTYPRYLAKTELDGVRMNVKAFAPVTPFCSEDMFIPAVITRFTFSGAEKDTKINVNCRLNFSLQDHTEPKLVKTDKGTLLIAGHVVMGVGGAESAEIVPVGEEKNYCLKASLTVKSGAETKLDFFFAYFEESSRFRRTVKDEKSLGEYILTNTGRLDAGIDDFISMLPDTGDAKITEFTRWYSQAAVLLTKSNADGRVITMGYTEMNQRDSFWTSFLHLALFPELEKDMIRVSIANLRPDGKMPTTILPLIERIYDIDINEYFCLRIARYYRFHHDKDFLAECFGAYKKAVEHILTRFHAEPLPAQMPPDNRECYWADWKDVSYIIGRKYAPHFCLLWLAVLKEGAKLADVLGDAETKKRYTDIYDFAYETINKDVADGGLWDRNHYTEIWYDGRKIENVLQDQTVGILLDVVPEERKALIYEALKPGESDYGIRETYPYRTGEEVYDCGGKYHNGGIWPWLMFCDMTGRYQNGRAEEAEEWIRRLGHYDLEVPGDYRPNEYLIGESGHNKGLEVQGWSSALIGTLYFGAFDITNAEDGTVTITVRIPERDFETNLALPNGGRVRITRKNGEISFAADDKNRRIVVR